MREKRERDKRGRDVSWSSARLGVILAYLIGVWGTPYLGVGQNG